MPTHGPSVGLPDSSSPRSPSPSEVRGGRGGRSSPNGDFGAACHNPGKMNEEALRRELCRVGRLCWERGLVGAAEGNLSVRLANGRILCSPSGHSKGHLEPADLSIVEEGGAWVSGPEPSSELGLHLCLYGERTDCRAVVHAHPPAATAFALAGAPIPDDVLPEGVFVLGAVALAPFAFPGSEEVAARVRPFARTHDAILLANHGAVTVGRSLEEAYFRMETLERVAVVVAGALSLGNVNPLPADAVARLRAMRQRAKEGDAGTE